MGWTDKWWAGLGIQMPGPQERPKNKMKEQAGGNLPGTNSRGTPLPWGNSSGAWGWAPPQHQGHRCAALSRPAPAGSWASNAHQPWRADLRAAHHTWGHGQAR